ncbi:MAG TPA: hypothetical protein VGF51_18485 [Acidimicrobiales bacterium]
MPPTIFVFGIMKPTDLMGIVVEPIGSDLSLVVILTVVTRGGLLFSPLPNDSELLMGVLNNLL